ncbi:DNA translocase FtsK [Candidatus Chlorohelix sp.]|uniref:DNA translocase FtsK n=1 Tax=Candidatus Chlorohelix sp. TaxID=3139201 RepID=UPI00306E6DE5
MAKKESAGTTEAAASRSPRKSKLESFEPVINVQPLDPTAPVAEAPKENKRSKRMAGNASAAQLTLAPTRAAPEQMQAQGNSSVPAPRKRTPKTQPTSFHRDDKLPAIAPGARQEIYGILLIVFALIFFFGLFSQKGLIADAGMAVKRIFGLASYLIPVWMAFIGVTFFWEGLKRREFINQTRLLGGVLSILAFVLLLHLLDANPKDLAEKGGGGGYIGYYSSGFLAGMLQGIGAFLLLVALFIVGLIIAFNVSIRQLWQIIQGTTTPDPRQTEEPGELNIEMDSTIINPHLTNRSYVVNREEGKLEEDALLDSLLLPPNSAKIGNRNNVPTEITPSIFGAHLVPNNAAAPTDKKPVVAQNWKREDSPAPAELPRREWRLPELDMLANFSGIEVNEKDLLKKAKKIEETLSSFGVEAYVREVNTGPTVTQFALEPGFGVKVARITALSNDLALSLAAPAIRIEAPVPGQQRVGVEVPNLKIATVGMKEIMESEDFNKRGGKLKIALGRDVAGQPMVADLAKMPHLLIAGATGSGKSVCINSIIAAMLFQYRPDELKFIMVDPKMVELSTYNGIPHLAFPVVIQIEADPEKERDRARNGEPRIPTVMSVLKWTIREMEKRYKRLSLAGHRNIDSYNKAVGVGNDWEKLPFLVLIIDELADLMMVAPEEAESSICRLAQKARAVGIHLILATQRPSVDVVTGLIKANFPTRITFAVTSQTDSRVILDVSGAEKLLGRGDMLYLPSDAPKPIRVQGVFVSDEEIDTLVKFWDQQATFLEGEAKNFVQEQLWSGELNTVEPDRDDDSEDNDALFEQALQLVRESRNASISLLQRRLRVGYNRAARLIEQLEQAGVIGHSEGNKPRPVLLEEEDLLEPTSLTAAASFFTPMPPKPTAPSDNAPSVATPTAYKDVSPALNAQAKVNEVRLERRAKPAKPPEPKPYDEDDEDLPL